MAEEFGSIVGAAVSQNYDQQINDLFRYDQMRKQTQAMNDAKAKLFADDLEFQNAANEYDRPRLEELNRSQVMGIGKYMRENPGYSSDPVKMGQIKMMKRAIKDNPIAKRAVAVDSAFAEYLKDRQEALKSPNQWDIEALDKQGAAFQNYFKTGNARGLEGLQQEGEQPALYTRPEMFIDVVKDNQETGNKFKHNDTNSDINYLNNGREGGYRLSLKDSVLTQMATDKYNARKRQYDVQYTKRGIDPVQEIKTQIASGIEEKFDIGKENKLSEELYKIKYANDLKKSLSDSEGGKSVDPFTEAILKPNKSAPAAAHLAETFGSTIPHWYINEKGARVKNLDGDEFHYTDAILDKGLGEKGYKKSGEKLFPGYFLKTVAWAKEKGYINDKGKEFGVQRIKPEMLGKISFVEGPVDKDGKSSELVKIDAVGTVQANDPVYRTRYNALVGHITSKQKEAIGLEVDMLNEGVGQPQQSSSKPKLWQGMLVGTVGEYEGKKVRITGVGKGYEEIK